MRYEIDESPERFDLARAHGWIAQESYWAAGIPRDRFERAVRGSLTLGAYAPDGTMAAMARVVSDRATFAWICDVFVDAGHRRQGLGKQLMDHILGHPDLQGLRRRHLATRDAHGLYAQYGFGPLTGADRWMEIRDPDPYGISAPAR
jgi:GNAT superfamily N-acetyltransferase